MSFTDKCVVYISHLFLVSCIPLECIRLTGTENKPIDLKLNPASGLYESSLDLPFDMATKTISKFALQASCTNAIVPTCDINVELDFCIKGGACDESDPSYRTGTFLANGRGPAAYEINSGTRDFKRPSGTFDSVFDIASFDLQKIDMNLCYDFIPEAFNGSLYPDQAITSENGRFRLIYQLDGNLVLYDDQNKIPLWDSKSTGSSPGVAVLQDDGNLVVYDGSERVVYKSNIPPSSGSYLLVENSGNMAIYDRCTTLVWESKTDVDCKD